MSNDPKSPMDLVREMTLHLDPTVRLAIIPILDIANEHAQLRDAFLEMTDKYDQLHGQINLLAAFILAEAPGEPKENEGAVETAIRVMRNLLAQPAK